MTFFYKLNIITKLQQLFSTPLSNFSVYSTCTAQLFQHKKKKRQLQLFVAHLNRNARYLRKEFRMVPKSMQR